jgi:hypothetical protein
MLLWLAGVAAIAVAALVGAAELVGATNFEEREARIVGTALVGLLAGGAALAGLAAVEDAPRHPLGWIALVLATGTFAVLTVAIWWEAGWDRHGERLARLVLSALVLLLAATLVGTLRRALRLEPQVMRAVFWAFAGVVAGTAAFAVVAIWAPSVDEVGRQTERIETVERLLAALLVTIVGGFLFVPLLERALRLSAQRRERVDRRAP